MNKSKLKVAVIRQELVELTGDYRQALILNQLLYWTPRVRGFDRFLEEEKQRIQENLGEISYPSVERQNGWIYKTAEDMAEETMLGLAPKNMRRHIKALTEKGYVQERRNPRYNWDKTLQYRVDTVKLQAELYKLGYNMSIENEYEVSVIDEVIQEITNTNNKMNTPTDKEKEPRVKTSLGDEQKETAIPEITSQITPETTLKRFYNGGYSSLYPRSITYFGEYSYIFGEEHPMIKKEQLEKTEESIMDFMYNYDLDMVDLKKMIRKHFRTNYSQSIDYNINHFANHDLMLNRYHEIKE